MRTPLTRTAAGAVVVVMLVWLVLPIAAASAATATKVPDGEEAWFLARKEPLAEAPEGDPTCTLPTGCNVSGNVTRPSPHPEGVMVVAANAGDPDAQMFVNFDVNKLPFGAIVTGGEVTLPVARDPDARNVNEASAKMVACLVEGFIPGGTDAGSYKDRPAFSKDQCVDVKQAKADPLTFSVDLTRFGKLWSSGTPMSGITLKVDEDKVKPPAPQESWRVAFNTQRRADQKTEEQKSQPEESRLEYPAPTWTLQYRVEKMAPIIDPVTPTTTGGGGGGNPSVFPAAEPSSGGGGGDFSSGGGSVASGDTGGGFGSSGAPAADTGAIEPPADSGAPAVQEPATAGATEAAAPVAASPAAQTGPAGTSPAVWVMPLLALAMAAAMAWSLMQPVELVGEREGAVSKLMRTRRLKADTPST